MNTDTYINQRQQAEERLHAAEQAEQERVARETAAQREINAAKAQIAAIERQKRQDAIDELRRQNDAVIDTARALYIQVIAALDRYDIPAAFDLRDKATAAWQEHQQLQRAILKALNLNPHPNQFDQIAKQNGITQIYPLNYALVEYIAAAPDAQTRQLRQGFYVGLIGLTIMNPGKDYRAAAHYFAEQLRRQTRW